MTLVSFEQALALLIETANAHRLPVESVPLTSALGRTLAVAVQAPFDVPGFANSAMDGFALATRGQGARAGQRFRVNSLTLAGDKPATIAAKDDCVEIATGAPLPEGADCIVPYELVHRDGEWIELRADAMVNQFVRAAGEDYRRGRLALSPGRVLDASVIGVLASFGLSEVLVRRRPRIAVIITGSELCRADAIPTVGQLHDCDSMILHALLAPWAECLDRIGPIPDDRDRLANSILEVARDHEVVITTGGASAGRADFVPSVIREFGELLLWRVATRPGMPVVHGRIGSTLIYGLPGNPVSVFASVLTLLIPALRAMHGQEQPPSEYALLAAPITKSHARLEWCRGTLTSAPDGRRWIHPHPAQGSNQLRGVAESNALFRVPATARALGRGAVVNVLRFPP